MFLNAGRAGHGAPGISGVYLDTGYLGSGVLECLDELDMEPPWVLLQKPPVSLEYTWLQDDLV